MLIYLYLSRFYYTKNSYNDLVIHILYDATINYLFQLQEELEMPRIHTHARYRRLYGCGLIYTRKFVKLLHEEKILHTLRCKMFEQTVVC